MSYKVGKGINQCLGKGNGSGPSTWVVISVVKIYILRATGRGLNLITALSITNISFVCYIFVDDTDLVHTS